MYDAVVVGGGIVGASTAYHLARSGTRTLLLDRHDEGRATDAGAGIVSPATSSRTDDPDWFDFAVHSFEYYRTLVDRLETESDETTGVARNGLLAVAVDDSDVDRFERRLTTIERRSETVGYPEPGTVEEIDPDLAGELFPPLSDVRRAFKYEHGLRVDGTKLTTALQRAGENHGLAITHENVTGIEVEAGQVTGVEGLYDRYDTDAVVIAGGAWSGEFADDLGVAVPVEPHRGQLVQLGLSDENLVDWPIVSGFRDYSLSHGLTAGSSLEQRGKRMLGSIPGRLRRGYERYSRKPFDWRRGLGIRRFVTSKWASAPHRRMDVHCSVPRPAWPGRFSRRATDQPASRSVRIPGAS